jgi:hypothetical protein
LSGYHRKIDQQLLTLLLTPLPMSIEIGPFLFKLDATAIAGAGLWSLALYLGFSPIGDWVTVQLQRWFNYAERSLYTSTTEFEQTRVARESQNAFYASIFSILPFLLVGALLNYGTEVSLGKSWAISVGILACMGCGIYELGRRDGKAAEEDD